MTQISGSIWRNVSFFKPGQGKLSAEPNRPDPLLRYHVSPLCGSHWAADSIACEYDTGAAPCGTHPSLRLPGPGPELQDLGSTSPVASSGILVFVLAVVADGVWRGAEPLRSPWPQSERHLRRYQTGLSPPRSKGLSGFSLSCQKFYFSRMISWTSDTAVMDIERIRLPTWHFLLGVSGLVEARFLQF